MPTTTKNVNLSSLQSCHYLVLVAKTYASITIKTVSRFWATHKKRMFSRASVRWGIKLVSCLFWGKASLLIIFLLTLELLFAFAQPAYCYCEPANMALCVFKREINGKGLPRNNEVMRARLAEQQVSDLEASLPGGNDDADVRALMLDHVQSLKTLLQGFAKKGDFPDPEFLAEIVGFMDPTSLNSILSTLIIRLRLVRGEDISGTLSDILAIAERVRPPDLELNSEERRNLWRLLAGVKFSSNTFLALVREGVADREQILSSSGLNLNSPSASAPERTRAMFQLLLCPDNGIFPDSTAFKAAFFEKLSQQSWNLLSLYILLMKKLPMTPNVLFREINITDPTCVVQYLHGVW